MSAQAQTHGDWRQAMRDALACLERKDLGSARLILEAVSTAPDTPPAFWLMLADTRLSAGDFGGGEQALDQSLRRDGRFLPALLAKGELAARRGDDRAAVSFLGLALQQVPPDASPALAARLDRARTTLAEAQGRFASHLAAQLAEAGVGDCPPARFAEALSILHGQQEPQLQQPTSFYYPGLPQTAFYDPADFPWIATLEAAVPDMRAEVEALLADAAAFAPYVEADESRANRGHALLNDRRWSAFYLWKDGDPVADHAARCPVTMKALEAAPMPMIPGRAPNVLFSQLAPRTHIPPHWGMLNTRLICHIPLIVPEGCRLRVGNHERRVEAGKALLFDDSINHEAWNDSDETRVVLLLEVWNPALDEAERRALTAMFGAIGLYGEG